jgi:Acetyltransferase (GNAT) domain
VSVSVRPAKEADRPALFELFSVAFGSPADPVTWAWKYDRNPNRVACAVAVQGGRIVGYYGGFGTRYRSAEGNFPGVSASDVMTDPKARTLGRRALFSTLVEGFCGLCADAGMPFGFGFPNERHRLAGEKTIGYRPVEPVIDYMRELRAPSLLSRMRRTLLRVIRDEDFGAPHDALAETLHARPGWRTDRSRDVLEWRYRLRPSTEYLFWQLYGRNGRSRAYAVVRLVGSRAVLADLQAADERSGDIVDLLDAVSSDLPPAARTLEFRAGSHSVLAKRAEELGFAPRASDTTFEVRLFDPAFDVDRAGRAFDYRFGDHEIF